MFKKIFDSINLFFISLFILVLPIFASAHEVYVLDPEKIDQLKNQSPVSFYDIFLAHISDTIIWGLIVGFLIISIFIISISIRLENKFDKYLIKLKHFAPFIARVTAGLAFISCGYHSALFGPELPFSEIFGSISSLIQFVFILLGIAMVFGIYSRIAGLIGLTFFIIGIINYGSYMITYTNYFVEMLILILIGGHKFSISHEHSIWGWCARGLDYLANQYGEFAFLFLRIGFGLSLIYASIYAKILHNQLAIAVVEDFNLVSIFGFTPEFIVFGAAIIEILLGIFFIFGLEVRFTAIVINIFLTLSLLYFGEAVWPHIILIGIPIAFFCYGYDKYSLEGYFFKKGNREPIF